MNREEYRQRAVELAVRGEDLPQSVLTEEQVREIRHAAWKRKEIRAWVRDNVSDGALQKKLGITKRQLWDWRESVAQIRDARRDREELNSFVTENLTNAALAKKFNVNINSIYRIINGFRWIHVDAERGMVSRRPAMEVMQGSRRRTAPLHGDRKQGNSGGL